jgi:hypothetical protein
MLAKSTSSFGVPTSKEEGGIHILQQELEPSCRTNCFFLDGVAVAQI